jgi:hypothetical protein
MHPAAQRTSGGDALRMPRRAWLLLPLSPDGLEHPELVRRVYQFGVIGPHQRVDRNSAWRVHRIGLPQDRYPPSERPTGGGSPTRIA